MAKKGRPTKREPAVVSKLLAGFHNGLNRKMACAEAGISYETLRDWCSKDEEFSALIEEAEINPSKHARVALIGSFVRPKKPEREDFPEGEVGMKEWESALRVWSLWKPNQENVRFYLTRSAHDREDFATRSEHTGADGEPLFNNDEEANAFADETIKRERALERQKRTRKAGRSAADARTGKSK